MAIGVVAAVALVVAGAVLLGRRRPTDAHSVKGYRQTLTTLEHLQGHPRHDRTSATRAPEPAPRFDPQARSMPRPPRSVRRAQRSLEAMNRGPRHVGAPLLALVILVAVIGAIVYVGVRSHHAPSADSRTTDSTGNPTTHHHKSSGSTTTTTTTLPSRYTAVNTTTSSATYAPATTSYTLSVGATTGRCWMSVTEANGTTLMAQTLTSGSTRSFTISGKATILIGAPSVARLKIDDVPAQLPDGALAPYTVTLVPAS